MKRIIAAVIITTAMFNAVVFGQASLLPTLQQVRLEFPTDWSHEDRGRFLNKVAWIHRAEGWGLLHKPGGNRCPTPQGVDVSCDYLVYRPTMQGFDVLENETNPAWQMADSFVSQPERWVPPVAPSGSTPTPTPQPAPGPTPPISGIEQELLDRIIRIEATTNVTYKALVEHEAKEALFRDAVESEYKKFGLFIAKYIAPVVGALLIGREMGQ